MQWDDQNSSLVDDLGRGVRCNFIGDKDQADRWTAAGYDFETALVRYTAFRSLWSASKDAGEAATVAEKYVAVEQAEASRVGIISSDPDFWRIGAVAKHMIW